MNWSFTSHQVSSKTKARFSISGMPILRWTLVIVLGAWLVRHYGLVISTIRWVIYLLFLPLITFTLTLRLDGWRVLLLLVLMTAIFYAAIYYFILRRYSRYRAPPPRNLSNSIVPGASTLTDLSVKPPTHADLLAKIRIFGYLEPEVYAELLRAVEERVLVAGQAVRSEGSFVMVVEGTLELRIRKAMVLISDEDEEYEGGTLLSIDDNDYSYKQSLKRGNEMILSRVKPGGVLSSLFDILTVLTRVPINVTSTKMTDENASTIPNLTTMTDLMEDPRYRVRKVVTSPQARLLLIPETALRQMAIHHPRAAAHMIQIIMARFHRATLMTLQKYLGLSREALHMVRAFNQTSSLVWNEMDDSDSLFPKLLTNVSDISPEQRQHLQQRIFAHLVAFLKINPKNWTSHALGSESISLISLVESRKCLVKQGERNPGLIILLQGKLVVACEGQGEQHQIVLGRPGNVVGLISSLFGHHSLVTVSAGPMRGNNKDDEDNQDNEDNKDDKDHKNNENNHNEQKWPPTVVAVVDRMALEMIMESHPQVSAIISRRLLYGIPPLVKLIDSALEWGHLEAGQTLCYQGELAEYIHMVLHGRLRTIPNEELDEKEREGEKAQGQIESNHEFGEGDSLGEMEILRVDGRWQTNVQAVRDSEVASMPKHLFDCLAQFHPEITLKISRLLATKTCLNPTSTSLNCFYQANPPNYRTVTVVPITARAFGVAMVLAHQLQIEASSLDSCLFLDKSLVSKVLGKHAFRAIGELKLLEWLQLAEQEHRLVLYLADNSWQSPWTRRCIRQADCILVVAPAEAMDGGEAYADSGIVGPFEQLVMRSMARKELVLVHETVYCPSGLTRKWLDSRPWISAHHHVLYSLDY